MQFYTKSLIIVDEVNHSKNSSKMIYRINRWEFKKIINDETYVSADDNHFLGEMDYDGLMNFAKPSSGINVDHCR